MKTITILALVITIALGLYVFIPGLAWQADRQVTRAQQNPSRATNGSAANKR